MKSKVYFVSVKESDKQKTIKDKFTKLLTESRLLDFLQRNNNIVIKIHFGEEGNTGFVRPEYIKVLCDAISERGASSFLSDTNTLYSGRRTNSGDHTKLAYEHGFTKDVVGVDVVIPDDSKKENRVIVAVFQKYVKEAKVVKLFLDSDVIIGVAHFKGHMMTGFGGALKNIGMGCASREGKLEQHSDLSPFVIENKCKDCETCIEYCPVDAISIKDEKAYIDSSICIGCATCIAVCPETAIDVKWEHGADTIQEKMVEYTKALLDKKKDKSVFINFLIKITKECDCLAKDDPRIAPDIGILVSSDPVAIDKASLDLVIKACRNDIFKEVHPNRDGFKQLAYGNKLGLGNLEYELIELG